MRKHNSQFSIFNSAEAQNLTGRDIVQRVKDRPDGNTRYAEMQLTLVKKNGDKRERKMVSWAATDQIHLLLGYDLFYAEKGMFLTYDHNSEVWLKLKYSF